MEFGSNLKKYREQKKIKQSELAEKIGVNQKDISRWERGERVPGAENIKKIAETLNVSADKLLGIQLQEQEERKMGKLFEIVRNRRELNYKKRNEIKTGCTLDQDCMSPEIVKSFKSKEDALRELKNYKSDVSKSGGLFIVEEYYIEENTYDEDGERIEGGDIIEFSELEIEVIEKPTYEVIKIVDNYADAEKTYNEYEGPGEVYINL